MSLDDLEIFDSKPIFWIVAGLAALIGLTTMCNLPKQRNPDIKQKQEIGGEKDDNVQYPASTPDYREGSYRSL